MAALVHSLPPEILARIFSEATCYCRATIVYDLLPVINLVTISAVCKQWRGAALSYQSLWTHLDLEVYSIGAGCRYYSPKLWQERSRGAPLYIHIRQYRQPGDSGMHNEQTTEYYGPPLGPMIARLGDFLQLLMPQVRSLDLAICWTHYGALKKLLAGWTTYGASGLAKELIITSNSGFWATPVAPCIHFDSSLDSLEILHLDLAVPSWSNLTLSSLTVLHLDARLWWRMSQSELESVLTSCPKLRRLTLAGFHVERLDESAPNPVRLNELQVLDIGSESRYTLASFLAMIRPGNNPMRLKITLRHGCLSPDEVLSEMHPFLARANVNVCELISHGMPCFASQIGSLPRVRTLALRGWYFCDSARLSGDTIRPETYNGLPALDPHLVHWSDLRELYLDFCTLEKTYLCQLLSHHSIPALHVRNCYYGREAKADFRMSPQTYEEYAQLLSEVVPEVTYAEDGREPWP